ncbi:MAG: type I polyketide synthase [Gemmatimonadetes bacterium]|nr:type I polyketide synthase [Gemmatimonadota bacterium]MYB61769.1 type I polyketide synthase [Gemmatimonadota bacterium]
MPGEPIAITGISCRFPGGISTPQSFWGFVLNGKDAIRPVPDERKSLWNPWPDGGDFPEWGGFVDEIDRFDAAFFNISPREARHIDPQQRILLELAWEALEDARIPPARLEGRPVGVYMGIFLDEYWDLQRYAAPSQVGMHTNTGGTLSIAANRISYFLDLKGPSIAVDTACSSSLTAIHLACRDIQAGTCTAALAGGANLLLTPQTTRGFEQAQMLSPDGRCRAFDQGANGYGRSDGAGIIVLKRLSDAVEDGDAVYAVIHGSAINQDGRSRGLTVPGQSAQQTVIEAAGRAGGVSAAQFAFVEAHGTGTPTGDPVEAMAIGRATGDAGCLIGSVKTNIGHTEAAAGVAGLIKAALALKHGILPPSLHFGKPNPDIPFEELGLKVATEPVNLPGPTYAGVNSFGFGGANAHVVLGSPPVTESPRHPADVRTGNGTATVAKSGSHGKESSQGEADPHDPLLLTMSAHSAGALKQKAVDTVSLLRSHPDIPPDDFTATLALHRSDLDHRLALVYEDLGEAARNLEEFCAGGIPDRLETARKGAKPAPVVFVFTGMGPQWFGMGKALYRTDPVFRDAMDAFDLLYEATAGRSIKDAMWSGSDGERIIDVEIAQPANMAIQWALAVLWRSLGIEPQIVVGHSVGEIAGACVVGALSLEEGVRIIYQRSRLQKEMQGKGEMLAVGVSSDEAEKLVQPYDDGLSIAAVNSPVSVTISGEAGEVERLQETIEDRRLFCQKLHTEIAYHSGQMDGIRDDFLASLNGLSPSKTHIPLLSTVTGAETDGTELDADHWWRNIRSPVLFDQTFDQIPGDEEALYIQIGPHPVLSAAIYENLAHHGRAGHALASLRRDRGAWDVLLESVAKCYVHGHDILWERLVEPPRTRVPLPPYPWQKERYWLDGMTTHSVGLDSLSGSVNLGAPVGPDGRRFPQPLIGRAIESSVDSDFRVWERAISLASHPILVDHTVLDRSIMPLAGQIEMLIETLDETEVVKLPEVPVAFTDLKLLHPLILPETGAHLVQVVRGQNRYTLSSKSDSQETASTWLAHMRTERSQGAGATEVAGMTENIDLEGVRSRCDRRITNRRFYERASESGFEYGPAFRQVDDVVYSDREALVTLAPRDEGHGSYRLHPGVLDAGLQVLLLLVPDDGPHLPVGVETVVLQRLPDQHEVLVAYARLREISKDCGLLADMYLVDEKGLPVVALEGVVLSPASGLKNRHNIDNNPHGLYREEWVDDNRWTEHLQPGPASHWFVLSDDRRLGRKLADALSQPGVEGEFIDITGSGSETNLGALADKLRSVECDSGSYIGLAGIWTGGDDRKSGRQSGQQSSEQSCHHTGPALESFELVRTVLDNPDLPCRLRLITAGAQSVKADDLVSPAYASIWGCGRVAMREHPELDCTLIDVPAGTGGTDVGRLASIVGADSSHGEFAVRGSGVFTRRLVPLDLERSNAKTVPVTACSKSSYVLAQSSPGSIDDLHFKTKTKSCPGPDEVVVRVRTAALNFRDVLTALGMLKEPSRQPSSFGWECVGEVVACGDRADSVEIGDVVMGMMPGAMAGHVTVKAGLVVRKPEHLGIEEAATLPVAFLTAYLGLVVRGGMSAGDRVLIHNATGGVGLAALQIAQQAEAEVIATAGSKEKRALLKTMGVSHVMDSRSLEFAKEIMEKTDGKGMDIVLNTLSGPAMRASLSLLAPHGRFIEIGKTDLLNHGSLDLNRFDQNRSYHPIDLAQFIEERPDRAGSLLQEVVDMAGDGRIRPLPYQTFPMEQAREAIRFMSQARHTGKLVLVDDGAPIPVNLGDDDPVIRPGGTYLVAGGTGGIGRFLTGWLLDRGAGRVVVTGRRRVEETALEADPAGNVRYVQADASDREAIGQLITDLGAEHGPVRGVFHAAGVLDDGILLTQTVERFGKVLGPKTSGAWLLHELTRDLDLDLFVLFSSAASLVGTAGQAPYAAANAFLDGLANLRRHESLPVTSINWGPWEGTGMAADEHAVDRLRRQGLRPIPPDEAGALLDRLLRRDVHRVGVMPTTEPAGQSLLAPYLSPVDRPERAPPSITPLSRADLNALATDKLRVYIEDYVNDAIGRIVEVDPDNVDQGQTWRSLGVDSLMAVELRNRFEVGLHVSIPVESLQSETAIEQTVDTLLEGLKATSRT